MFKVKDLSDITISRTANSYRESELNRVAFRLAYSVREKARQKVRVKLHVVAPPM